MFFSLVHSTGRHGLSQSWFSDSIPGMDEKIAVIHRRLTEEGETTVAFFRGLPSDLWARQLYEEGPWTVRDALAHMVSAERNFALLVDNIRAGGAGAPEDFSIDGFNAKEVASLADAPPETLIAEFGKARQRVLTLVESMRDEDLKKEGRHPYLGVAPLDKIIKLIYRHTMLHQRDIKALS
jgi:hypothetical protein